jgi:hypothetical protein
MKLLSFDNFINESSKKDDELELKKYLNKKHSGYQMYPAESGEIMVGFLRKPNDYTWDDVMTYYWNTNYDIEEVSIIKVKI